MRNRVFKGKSYDISPSEAKEMIVEIVLDDSTECLWVLLNYSYHHSGDIHPEHLLEHLQSRLGDSPTSSIQVKIIIAVARSELFQRYDSVIECIKKLVRLLADKANTEVGFSHEVGYKLDLFIPGNHSAFVGLSRDGDYIHRVRVIHDTASVSLIADAFREYLQSERSFTIFKGKDERNIEEILEGFHKQIEEFLD